jgi:NAD(P)H-hydrate repair Nnr-like enzyme with NAD(P)H-hydrate dehydratase domain
MRRFIASICACLLASSMVAPKEAEAAAWAAFIGTFCAIGSARKTES